ncbi:hypothetical protein Hoch_6175 [Haliangium ochraceum DSM 14365]|uniref:Uncharacterized protein n=1 Tax=Haliangium ochraceum (strain DSM 14365 / JCM 11303 / SMP-2) TaxID=502025 RepID=D0LLF4_HALO1|nr:hypothetical protein Hoch_6175 [Haliangium ochraceum DSM 14365]
MDPMTIEGATVGIRLGVPASQWIETMSAVIVDSVPPTARRKPAIPPPAIWNKASSINTRVNVEPALSAAWIRPASTAAEMPWG